MKKQILTPAELEGLGFKNLGKHDLEDGEFYMWWQIAKGECTLCITYEFNKKHEFFTGYVDFNGVILKGRSLSATDIKFLIELM